MTFGVAFTAHNRQKILDATLDAVKTHTPADIPVIVVDDGSTPALKVPDWVRLIRHDTPQGIPAGKNRCITELIDSGVEHLFLFDEDTRPRAPHWWRTYTDGAEPHYQYSWERFANNVRVPKMDVLYRDDHLIGYAWSMGCLVYIHRSVVDSVGGYDLVFTPAYEEHAEYSQRVHNAGHTSFVHQDHPAMRGNIWAADEHGAVKRSFDRADITKLVARNEQLRLDRADSTAYIEYRPPRDIILTSYFCSQLDPQRRRRAVAHLEPLKELLDSCHGRDGVVLHDQPIPGLPDGHVQVGTTPWCAYQQRWLSQWQYLRDPPEIRWCLMVDATDTRLLRDPFIMQLGVLYCGWEPIPVDCDWIRAHSPAGLKQWVTDNAHRMLLNTGVVGGDRETAMRLCRRMHDLWLSTDRKDPLYEMLLFNIAAYEHDVVTGPHVTTLFKSHQPNQWSRWLH